MKIEITYIPNTFNYGSCMMAISTIVALNKAISPVEFYVDCSTPEDLDRLRQETKLDCIYPNTNYAALDKPDHINNQGIHIILGGDSISEYYSIPNTIKRLKNIAMLSLSNKVFLLGQSIGPFTGERIDIAKDCLQNTYIYTRTQSNYEYLSSLNIPHVICGKDLAFYPLPLQTEPVKSLLDQYHLVSNEYITLVPSGLYRKYTLKWDEYIDEYVKIVELLLAHPSLSSKKLLLLPHVTVSGSDIISIEAILAKLPASCMSRIIPITSSMLPSQARIILGHGFFTVTGRMHAAVSTFYMRKPAIALSYSVKYGEVLGQELGFKDLIIEAADPKLWHEQAISHAVSEKVDYVLANYNTLLTAINEIIPATVSSVKKEFNNFTATILSFKK